MLAMSRRSKLHLKHLGSFLPTQIVFVFGLTTEHLAFSYLKKKKKSDFCLKV